MRCATHARRARREADIRGYMHGSSERPPPAAPLSAAAARRLGLDSKQPVREPSHARLLCDWVLQQVFRWARGDIYPHLHQSPNNEGAAAGFTSRTYASARKLATRQDRFHLHKAFGLICMLNFLYHISALLMHQRFTPANGWLAAHAALALTSRAFYVSERADRVSYGYLTEEIRWHALLFSLRNIAFVVLAEVLRRCLPHVAADDSTLAPCFFAACALPFHLAVDAATRAHGMPGWTSIRGHATLNMLLLPAEHVVRRALSAMQFINNHALLFGGARRAEIAFLLLAWVQLNAFCMTLRKKAIITEESLMRTYTLLSVLVTAGSLGLATDAVGSLAAGVALVGLRGLGVSKYWLWASALVARLPAPGVVLPSQRAAESPMIILLGGAPLSLRLPFVSEGEATIGGP